MQKDIVLKLNPFRWDPSLILKNEGVWGLQRNNLALVKNCRKVRGRGVQGTLNYLSVQTYDCYMYYHTHSFL